MSFSRRQGVRHNRGRIASYPAQSVAPADPLAIFGANLIFWLRGDSYVESGGAGTGVTQATDLSAAGANFTNAGGTARPTAVASVAAANNQPGWTFDGAANRLDNTGITRPAPATTPTWFWMVAVIESYTTNEVLVCGVGTNTMIIQQATASPLHRMLNPTGANSNDDFTAFPAASRFAWEFTGSTADYLQIGGTTVIGSSAGNNSTTGFRIGVNNSGAVFSNLTLLEWLALPGFPGAGPFAMLEAYGADRYGSALFE